MADITIDAATLSGQQVNTNDRAQVAVSASNIYQFGADSDTNFKYWKSTDGGQTWAAAVEIGACAASGPMFSIWYDKWTPGVSTVIIHTWHYETTADDVIYRSLDTSSDTLGTATVVLGTTSSAVDATTAISGALAQGGNLYVAFALTGIGTNEGFYRSIDAGANWTSRANPNEGTGDYYSLFPGNEGDTQDMWLVYWDTSADEISLKTYDDSGNSWAETSISGSMTDIARTTVANQFCGSIRLSDKHLILTAWNTRDASTSDMNCWDINGSASITAKTDVVANSDDCQACAVYIDQTTNAIYVAYIGKSDGSETLGTSVLTYYKKSTDGGATWGSETPLGAGSLNITAISCDLGSAAGRFIPAWFDDGNDDILTNYDNSVVISASSIAPLSMYYHLQGMR